MRVPESLESLIASGVIDEVLRPLMSGKEAQVYLVTREGERRVAKVYKEANNRSFKHRADYSEGRAVRDTRQMRAMAKKSRFGREQLEQAWKNAEVDTIYRLAAAKVRVPEPYDFVDGVLVMELVAGADGEPAPRLVDVSFTKDEAVQIFEHLIKEVVRMLCAGVVHGDLSDFNVLITEDGPVIIDFPQAVDPAKNNNARKLLIRDVRNLQQFLGRFAPHLRKLKYGEEMWALYEKGKLEPDTKLTGTYKPPKERVEVSSLLAEIEELERENRERRERLGLGPARPARKPIAVEGPRPKPLDPNDPAGKPKRKRRRKGPKPQGGNGSDDAQPRSGGQGRPPGDGPPTRGAPTDAGPGRPAGESTPGAKKKRRRRRRRRRGGGGGGGDGGGASSGGGAS